jgi:hypothetical protein
VEDHCSGHCTSCFRWQGRLHQRIDMEMRVSDELTAGSMAGHQPIVVMKFSSHPDSSRNTSLGCSATLIAAEWSLRSVSPGRQNHRQLIIFSPSFSVSHISEILARKHACSAMLSQTSTVQTSCEAVTNAPFVPRSASPTIPQPLFGPRIGLQQKSRSSRQTRAAPVRSTLCCNKHSISDFMQEPLASTCVSASLTRLFLASPLPQTRNVPSMFCRKNIRGSRVLGETGR